MPAQLHSDRGARRPLIRIRMLSVDTPEVTARSAARAREIDEEFRQLAEWIGQGRAPISQRLGDVVAPK